MSFNSNELDKLKYGENHECYYDENSCCGNYNRYESTDNSLKYFFMFLGFMMLLFFSMFALIILNA